MHSRLPIRVLAALILFGFAPLCAQQQPVVLGHSLVPLNAPAEVLHA